MYRTQDAWVQRAADRAMGVGSVEPTDGDVREMRSAHMLFELTDWCKQYRGRRIQLQSELNIMFQGSGMGLKVIRWSKWDR